MSARRGIAALAMVAVVADVPSLASAFTVHPAVTVRAALVEFYAGHLVLDARGGATIDDGVLHVSADRIVFDMTNHRYVAAGNVTVVAATSAQGAALGVDPSTHQGLLVALAPVPATFTIDGSAVAQTTARTAQAPDPLALPDLEGELPFADATQAVVHIGADVRLGSAHVLVPGGKNVYIPSYVYTFSSDVGYSASNVQGSGEEVPIYFGSTRNSIQGAHFTYNPATKVGLGLDHRVIDGDKAYDLFSVSPMNGPNKNANFTWQEQINGHASQTLNALSSSGVGARWNYDLSDNLHRSFVDISSNTTHESNGALFAWQGAYEPLGAGWLGNDFQYHLRSEYGRFEVSGLAAPIFHSTVEAGLQTAALPLDPSTSLSLAADWRELFDNQPHRQFGTVYSATLQHRWNSFVTTSLTDYELPVVDYYPSVADGTRTYQSEQIGSLSYDHGAALGFTLNLTHISVFSVPAGAVAQPWSAFVDARFRVNSSLSLDISRSYGFGYLGQRLGSLGFQILP